MVQSTAGQRWMRSSEAAARWAGLAVAAIGVAVLVGWWADVPTLRTLAPGLAHMKPNTALSLALCGCGLALGAGRDSVRWWRVFCGAAAALIGGVTIAEHALEAQSGIDRWLIGSRYPHQPEVRMTLGAATAIACGGIGLALTAWPARRLSPARIAESSLAVTVMLLGLLALLGYLYGVRSLYQTAVFSSMALHTASALTLLGAGLMLSRPRQGLARLLGSQGGGGELARRLLGFFLVFAPLLGWACLRGQHARWYDTEFGLALLVWVTIVLGVVMVWWTARALDRAETWRTALQEDLAASITREHATAAQRGSVLDALPLAIALLDSHGHVVSLNRRWKEVSDNADGAQEGVGAEFADWAGPVLGIEKGAWWSVSAGVWGVLSGARAGFITEVSVKTRANGNGGGTSNGNGNGGGGASPERDRWLEIRVAPVHGVGKDGSRAPGSTGEPRGAVVMVSDVTQRRRLEEQLVHSQRLEAVGRLAGGVAHDFNNLLTAVTGHRALAQAAIDAGLSAEANLQAIEQAARSGAELTQELLAFGRRQVLSTRVVNVAELIGNVRRLIDRSLGEAIGLRVVTPPGVWPAKVDPARIEQVLMNLVINAKDAMHQGAPALTGGGGGRGGARGSVVIEAENAVLDEQYASERPGVTPGPYVCVSVSDTGVGMSKEVMARIFEPFFTTKERGKGTGLGLATSFGIVKQHGGHIAVYSEQGQGTIFRVYLPAAEGAAVEERAVLTAPRAERGHERILLVDDHPGARAAVAGMLRSLGYTVIEAGDAAETERLARAEGPGLDLLLSDVVLPDAKGPELARRVAPLCPRAGVLFISGYTANAIEQHGEFEGGGVSAAFLSKPFTLEELAAKVRVLLDRKA